MKTTAFLTRVTICLLLSLIPVTELENRFYSVRMEVRQYFTKKTPQVVILEASSHLLSHPDSLHALQVKLSNEKPALIIVSPTHQWNHLLIDPDGMIRRAILFPRGQASLTFEAYSQLHLDPAILKRIGDPHLINFLGPAGTFSHCSISDLSPPLLDLSSCSSLADKTVLLIENSDSYPNFHTPMGEMTPAEILANDIQTIVYGHPIRQVSALQLIPLTLAMVLLGAFYIIYYPVHLGALAITGTGIAVVLILFQLVFQIFGIYIPSANIICSLFVTYLVFTGYRLALQENLQWRTLKQAQYLRELDQMKTNFLSLMSHDLKTPLAKIQAVVERLRRELLLPADERSDWRELIDSIENSNHEMKRFITSILNLSKIESQKVILNKKSNDINLLIQQALKRLRPLAQQKNIQIEESLEPLFSIECDEDLMRQVLTNLIDNAIKFSPTDSKVIVRSKEEDGFVRVDVEDFGPGIPKDQLPLMFRKFSRFLRPIKEPVKGTGLGLYLSKYFIELHGGSIRVRTIEGQGTVFSFTLPLRGEEEPSAISH